MVFGIIEYLYMIMKYFRQYINLNPCNSLNKKCKIGDVLLWFPKM